MKLTSLARRQVMEKYFETWGKIKDMKLPTELQKIIARFPAWQGLKDLQLEPIAGLTNVNYRVTAGGESFVLRVSGENTARLGIDRACEIAALQSAFAAGIAPETVAFLPPEGHLVTRWVDGRIWSAAEFRTPKNVRLLTETVRRIHALPTNAAVFSPFQRIDAFLKTAHEFGVNPPPNFEQFQMTVQAVEMDQRLDTSAWRHFCHNDLASCNYLYVQCENSIKVLYWEFAGLGDIYYDLATIVYTHDSDGPIPPELENEMLAYYFGAITPFHRKRLAGMKFMLMLFSAAWGLAQAALQSAGRIPPVEGFNYLKFSEYLFLHDIPELQAQYKAIAED